MRNLFVRSLCLAGALTMLAGPAPALACYDTPDELPTFRESVDNAETIVLARIVSGQKPYFGPEGIVDFEFEVLEALKGDSKDFFKLRAAWVRKGGAKDRGHFDNHTAPAFWDRQITRLDSVADCGQSQKFDPDATYLIFDHLKAPSLQALSVASEEIADPAKDEWLAAVRTLVSNSALSHARMAKGIDYLKEQRAVALVSVDNCMDQVRDNAHYLAQVSPLSGQNVSRDNLNPALLSDALAGCDGFTVLLGIFYESDKETGLAIDVDRTPLQQFVPVRDGQVSFDDVTTEIGILGDRTLTLEELVAALLPGPDMSTVE